VRDHAAGDAAMLRAAEANRLGERLFVRGDGTLAYFFALDELRSLLENAGLVNVDLKLALVETRNRKTGARIRRIFATGSAVKST
jgi:methyltransferase-like protein 6